MHSSSMVTVCRTILLAIAVVFAIEAAGADVMTTPARQLVKVADGIYVIRHKEDPSPGYLLGNTTVIIGQRETFVVDSGQMPSQAREDIAQIRQLTGKPVRYLLNTHWHTDHNGGNHEYMEAFPSVAIIATSETRQMMDGFAPHVLPSWTKQGRESRAGLTKILESGKGSDGKPLTKEKKNTIAARLKMVDDFVADANTFVYQAPTLMFDKQLTVDMGATREVRVQFLGRANTGGDAIVYLPKEKVLITGDILVYPVPFAYDGYPSEWIQTLRTMAEFDVETIVPGHGDVLHDKTYLNQVRELLTFITNQVDQQLGANRDATLEEVRKAIDLSEFRTKFAQGDPRAAAFFDNSIRDGFVEIAYHEWKQR